MGGDSKSPESKEGQVNALGQPGEPQNLIGHLGNKLALKRGIHLTKQELGARGGIPLSKSLATTSGKFDIESTYAELARTDPEWARPEAVPAGAWEDIIDAVENPVDLSGLPSYKRPTEESNQEYNSFMASIGLKVGILRRNDDTGKLEIVKDRLIIIPEFEETYRINKERKAVRGVSSLYDSRLVPLMDEEVAERVRWSKRTGRSTLELDRKEFPWRPVKEENREEARRKIISVVERDENPPTESLRQYDNEAHDAVVTWYLKEGILKRNEEGKLVVVRAAPGNTPLTPDPKEDITGVHPDLLKNKPK